MGEKQAVKACNVSLPDNANDKYHRLVQLAKKVFHTRMAAISFIDGEHELFKAEHALGRRSVARDESIGAHVLLLSGEPMVILDAAKVRRSFSSSIYPVCDHPAPLLCTGRRINKHSSVGCLCDWLSVVIGCLWRLAV